MYAIEELYGSKLSAMDGEIGKVGDFRFDDRLWCIRYVVAETGSGLSGRRLLLSPHSFRRLGQNGNTLYTEMQKNKIENSPPIDSPQSVSLRDEIEHHRYFRETTHRSDNTPANLRGDAPTIAPEACEGDHLHRTDRHLQSTRALTGGHVHTINGVIGSVCGFVVDDQCWAIRQLIVETGQWYSGRHVLIATDAIRRFHAEDSSVVVSLTKEDIERPMENCRVQNWGETLRAQDFCA